MKKEITLLRSLLSHETYTKFNERLGDELFGKQLNEIKHTILDAHEAYGRDLSLDEVRHLFHANHPTSTESAMSDFDELLDDIGQARPLGNDVVNDVLRSIWRKSIGDKIADHGFDLASGRVTDLEPLLKLMREVDGEEFTPATQFTKCELSIEGILERTSMKRTWAFNLPALANRVGGCGPGHFIVGGARPDVGKTSFHASLNMAPGGFIHQNREFDKDAAANLNIGVFCNEEEIPRVASRYLNAATGMTSAYMVEHLEEAHRILDPLLDRLTIMDSTGRSIEDIDRMVKQDKIDIAVIDILDKCSWPHGVTAKHDALGKIYEGARNIAKNNDAVVFGLSQLSAEAEGRTRLDYSMLADSKTAKAGEADLICLIGKEASAALEDDTNVRHLNVPKNKIHGGKFHEVITLDVETARYAA